MRNKLNKQTDVSGFLRCRNPYWRASGMRVWPQRAPFPRGVCRQPPPPCYTSKEEERLRRTDVDKSSVFRITQNEAERDKHQILRRDTQIIFTTLPLIIRVDLAIHSLLLLSVFLLVRKCSSRVKSNLVGRITAMRAPRTCSCLSIIQMKTEVQPLKRVSWNTFH